MSVNKALTVDVDARDTYLDLVRVTCVLTIVGMHWLTARAWTGHGQVGAVNVLDEMPGLAVLGWFFMVCPMLMFVGGAANYRSYLRNRDATAFFARRARRLLVPISLFAAFWLAVELVLHALDLGGDGLFRWVGWRGVLPFGPLWFIGVYLVLVALTPVTARLHRRWGAVVPVAISAGTICVDLARFLLEIPLIGWLNLVLAWLVPYQLGYGYATGRERMTSGRTPALLSLTGLAGLLLLAGTGWYPVGIGGTPGDRFSNMSPPTVCITALSLWQVGLVLLGSRHGTALMARPRVAVVVTRLNSATMTIYLWHMTAMLLGLVVLLPLGVADDAGTTTGWLAERPAWLALDVVCLVLLVRIFGPAEWRRSSV
jgi:hypothetical protein